MRIDISESHLFCFGFGRKTHLLAILDNALNLDIKGNNYSWLCHWNQVEVCACLLLRLKFRAASCLTSGAVSCLGLTPILLRSVIMTDWSSPEHYIAPIDEHIIVCGFRLMNCYYPSIVKLSCSSLLYMSTKNLARVQKAISQLNCTGMTSILWQSLGKLILFGKIDDSKSCPTR